jgi:hypothetical protein
VSWDARLWAWACGWLRRRVDLKQALELRHYLSERLFVAGREALMFLPFKSVFPQPAERGFCAFEVRPPSACPIQIQCGGKFFQRGSPAMHGTLTWNAAVFKRLVDQTVSMFTVQVRCYAHFVPMS